MARDLTPPEERRRARTTVAVYLGALGFLALLVLWSSRAVLFQPWTARAWVTGAVADGKLYLLGGRGAAGVTYDQVYRVDPRTRRVRTAGVLPSPRFGAAAATVDRTIVLAGGLDDGRPTDEILALDTTAGGPRLLGRLPTASVFAAAATLDGLVYLVGGWDGGTTTDLILAVDPITGQTRVAGRLPGPREHAAAVALGDTLYVAGGVDGAGTYLDDVLEIRLGSDGAVVTRTARLPGERSRLAAVAVATGVLLLGGWNGRELADALLVDNRGADLEVRRLPDLPAHMSSFHAASIGGRIYLVGGADRDLPRQIGVWVWDPLTGASEAVRLRGLLGG